MIFYKTRKWICLSLICCLFCFCFYKSFSVASINIADTCCCCKKSQCACDILGHPATASVHQNKIKHYFEPASCICKQQTTTTSQLKNNLFFKPITPLILPFFHPKITIRSKQYIQTIHHYVIDKPPKQYT